jgi:hypothetical protein
MQQADKQRHIPRQQLNKCIPMAMNVHATVKELLDYRSCYQETASGD